MSAAVVRRESALGEDSGESRAFGCDAYVAGERQSEPGSDRGSVDGGNGRARESAQQQRRIAERHSLLEQRLVAGRVAFSRLWGKVGAGAETTSRSGEYEGARAVLFTGVNGGVEVRDEGAIYSVHLLGTIERYDAHVSNPLGSNG